MRIRSVSVENFGTIGAVDLELGDGMTVICGPNESGKSTLQRAIWFALTRRATSQAEEIREIEPNGGGTPRVEVELDGAEGTYAVEKTFAGQSGSTTLRADRDGMVDTYSGEEAGEKLRGVLGFGEISGRPPTPDHTGFWPVTWVRQAESGSDPGEKLAEEGNEATVSEALAEIGGDVLAGSEGGDLIEKAREEYGRFFTPNGNKTTRSGAPLHEAEKRLEEAEEKLRRLEEKQREYERDLEEFSRLQSEITGLEEEQIPGLKEDAEAARKAHSRLEELRGTLGTKEAELETAETKLQAEGRLSRREELQEEIDTLSDEVEGLEETASLKAEDLNAHREQRESLVETKKSVEERHGEMRSRVNLLEAHVDVLRLEDRLGELNESLETVQGHEEELEGVREEMAEIQITEEDIEALEAQKEERDRAEVELETAAAQVRLSAHENVEVTEGEDTTTLQAGEESEHLVDEPTTFSVGDALDIRVEPGGEELSGIRSRLEEAQQAYEETLSEHGVGSLSEARARQREKSDLSGQEDRLEFLIGQATSEGGLEALEEKKREAEAALKSAEDKKEDLAGSADVEDLNAASETEDQLQGAREELESAEEDLTSAKEALSGHDAETTELKQAKNLAEQELSGKQDELQGAKETLEEHKSQHGPSGDLRAEVESAEEKRDRLEEEVGELRKELQELDPGQVEQEKERAEDALENARESLRERENDLSELRGRLTSSDLRGLHERLEGAREEAETARAEVERWERKAQAAKRLYETLSECRSEAQKEHLTPLRNEVETLLGRFFADESPRVEFEEDFGISRLSRSSDGSFEFGQLSAGAREQLGLLVRLGMARLVGKEAHHPVFLDEPLADTDSDRFDLIAQVLREMAGDLQLIVTTCHRDRYRRLGVRIVDLPRKKREAEMA